MYIKRAHKNINPLAFSSKWKIPKWEKFRETNTPRTIDSYIIISYRHKSFTILDVLCEIPNFFRLTTFPVIYFGKFSELAFVNIWMAHSIYIPIWISQYWIYRYFSLSQNIIDWSPKICIKTLYQTQIRQRIAI